MATRALAVVGAMVLVVALGAGCSDGDGAERDRAGETAAANDAGSDAGSGGASDDGGAPAGSDPELRQEYIDAIVGAAGTDEASGVDRDAVECFATSFVDAAGTDALSAAVTPEELAASDQSPAELGIEFPEGAGRAFYDAVSGCVDLRSLLADNLAGDAAAVRDCIDGALDDDMVEDYFVGLYIGGSEATDPDLADVQQRITDAIEPCFPTE